MKCQSVTFLELGTCGTCVVNNLYDTLMSKNATRNYQQNILIKIYIKKYIVELQVPCSG